MKSSQLNHLLFILMTLFASANISNAHAQGMSDAQMQQMMQQAGAMQKCFENIDQSAIQGLEAKGRNMESKIRALCSAGKRDEAMRAAMKYSKEIHNDPQLKAIRKCSEMMQGMMANMPQPFTPPIPDAKDKGRHLCDDM